MMTLSLFGLDAYFWLKGKDSENSATNSKNMSSPVRFIFKKFLLMISISNGGLF